MFKKTTKFFAGVALLVQSLSAVIMFFITLGKKKSSSGAWLALATITGAAGGYLVYDSKKYDDLVDKECDDCPCDGDCDDCPCDASDDDVDIDESELFSRNDESEAE